MAKLKFYTLDVFSKNLFGGNPLAIFLEADKLSQRQMQCIAAEINYSETVFILKPDNIENSAKVKIFTPKNELPFAGHPNVGAGFLLSMDKSLVPGKHTKEKLIFEEKAGLVNVFPQYQRDIVTGSEIEAPNLFSITNEIPVSIVSDCVGLDYKSILVNNTPPVIAGVGLEFAIAEVENKKALDIAKCDLSGFEKANKIYNFKDDFFSLMLFSKGKKNNLFARVFAPLSGIIEDAATGSACGALGGLMASLDSMENGKFNYTIHQGEALGRPSIIKISVAKTKGISSRPLISGDSVLVSEGIFYI